MEIQIQVMDFQPFRQLQFQNTYELCWIRWYYDYPDPNNGYFDMFYSNKESGRRQAWSNAEFDELVVKGKEAADPDERLEYYRQAEQIMQDEVAYIPIVYRNAYDVYKPWVKGVPVNMQGFALPNGNIYVGMWNTVYTEGRPA
jgi:ABC-type transport system substrate-binding protein